MAPADLDDSEDRQVDVHSAEVPAGIRAAALSRWQPGHSLWRCPRLSAPRGPLGILGIGPRSVVIEWWQLDADGDLVEAYWEK